MGKREDGKLVMTYADGSTATINVPASAICKHTTIRALCNICKPKRPSLCDCKADRTGHRASAQPLGRHYADCALRRTGGE